MTDPLFNKNVDGFFKAHPQADPYEAHKRNTVYERAKVKCDCGKEFLSQLAIDLCIKRGHAPLPVKRHG